MDSAGRHRFRVSDESGALKRFRWLCQQVQVHLQQCSCLFASLSVLDQEEMEYSLFKQTQEGKSPTRQVSRQKIFADMSPLHSLLLLLLFAAARPQLVVNQTKTKQVSNPEKPEGEDGGEDVRVLLLQLMTRVEELERKLEEQQEERGKSCSLTRGPQQAFGTEGVRSKTFRCGNNSGLAKQHGCIIVRPGYQTGSVAAQQLFTVAT